MNHDLDNRSLMQNALLELKKLRSERDRIEQKQTEPIAIIGIGCRFPGGADNPEAYWHLLREGKDAIAEIPGKRWNIDAYYDPTPNIPGKMYARHGGFLKDVDKFDPNFFGISAREAESIDPQQRLVLEVSWEALENAGIDPKQLAGSQTGVFIGISSHDYYQLRFSDLDRADSYTGTGVAVSIAANRLSYLLDLRGPSWAADTACSSSLVAVHQACSSLRLGECQLALAGGVNLILSPQLTIAFSQAGMMAADGRCKTFDASADGYVRGEGCGVVILKRLSDAIADNDNILALIRGSAVNQDGRSNGLTAPNGPSQQAVVRQALANAKVNPAQIGYVEAHGTGTALGDPIELNSLKEVLMQERSPQQPCWIGSVKTNIGHLEAAAGIASLIKTVLSLEKEEIPPNLHLQQLNPHINLKGTPLAIPTEIQKWSREKEPRLAGVSAFGFGGTNAHIILEEAGKAERQGGTIDRSQHLLTLSAKSESALQELAQKYTNFLSDRPEISLADLCFSANTGRSHFDYRLAVIAESPQQLSEQLRAFSKSQTTSDRAKIAFLFTGQGSQYLDMGRQLYETQPIFRAAIDKCNELLESYLDKPLLEVLYSPSHPLPPSPSLPFSPSLINETAYTQPALFAIEYALAQLWQSWGIVPDAVIGHSVGEYAAACVAGVFSLEDGLKLIAERGRLMQALPGNGMMAAVFADELTVSDAIAPYSATVSIAAVNSPNQIVISGEREAVRVVLKRLESQGISAQPLKVSHAFHSPLMEPMLASFDRVAASVKFNAPRIPLVSNLTGKILEHQEILDRAYWCRHIREAVRFSTGMEALHQQGYNVFIEIGPKPILSDMGRKCLPEGVGTWLPSLKKGESDWKQMLTSLGELYMRGVEIDWTEFHGCDRSRRLVLPTYPFQRQRFWVQTPIENPTLINTVPAEHQNWFYTWQWRSEKPIAKEIPSGAIVILQDSRGIAENLEKQLDADKYKIYRVSAERAFQQKDKRNFAIDPTRPQDYDRVIEAIKADGLKISTLIHLWNGEPRLQTSADSVLFLGQALIKYYPDCPIDLLLLTQGAYGTSAEDSLPGLQQAIAATLAQTLAQENQTIQTKIVDVVPQSLPAEIASILFQEMKAMPSEEGIVAIRQGRRLIRTLEKMEENRGKFALTPGETWLIVGGTSDVGAEIAKGLASRAPINLVLTGRQTELKGDRIRVIQALEALGATVMYRATDVTDAEGMQQLMETVRSRFGHIDGVIHAAGVQDERTFKLLQKKPDAIAKVLAPKVEGTIILDRVTQDEPLKYFILISSAAASKAEWGANLGDYAAANLFLDNYAIDRERRKAPGRAIAVNFSLWRDKGMTKIGGLPLVAAAKAKGLNLLEPKQAVEAFLEALSTDHPVIHIIDWDEPALPILEPSTSQPQKHDLHQLVREILSQHLSLPAQQIEGYKTFQELGLDSLGLVEATKELSLAIQQYLSPTLFFEHQTPDDLANYLERQYGCPISEPKQEASVKTAEIQEADIAIIGMGCKIPGAENLEQYWELLDEGRSYIREIPRDRWSLDDYYSADTARGTYSKHGGFVPNPFDFDPMFFGISPREATAIDPQQRLFLEVAWQALQQAGYGGKYRTKEIGVFVGCGQSNYLEHFLNYESYSLLSRRFHASPWFKALSLQERQNAIATLSEVLQPSEVLPEVAAGNELNQIAARVSHCLDLTGPSLEVSTACSSSLVALHLACESLRAGESRMAIVGGVNLNLSPTPFVFLSRVGALSATGNCYPFDCRANGMVLGEGAGAIVLKPLKQALEDGDFIHGVIKGSAVNNDGHSQGITAPRPEGQAQAVRKAYQKFGIDPQTVSYIETHGTGTILGDPIEIEGMSHAFRTFTDSRGFCGIGSVKSSIGHLLAASGIISLIKVVLSMQHGKIPPTLGFEKPNPHIDFANTPFYVVGREGMSWSGSGSPLRAGVNGFGFGGTNCHVILEQAPLLPSTQDKQSDSPNLVCLSARSSKALQEIAKQLHDYLSDRPEEELSRVCYTLSNAQKELSYKASFLVRDRDRLLKDLTAIASQETRSHLYLGRSNPQRVTSVHLLLDGSTSLTPNDVASLRRNFPQFDKAYSDCEIAWKRASDDNADLKDKAYVFAVQYALAKLLMSVQLQPSSLLAQETGILVGACLTDTISLEAAMILLAQIEGKKIVIPLTEAIAQEPLADSWSCPLVTPKGTFKPPFKFSNSQLGSLVQTSGRLTAEHCQKINDESVYFHLGGSDVIAERSHSLASEQSLLDVLAQLYVAGVSFNRAALFPPGLRKVPLPTYPFDRETYKAPIARCEEECQAVVSDDLLAIEQIPSLSQTERQTSYRALLPELATLDDRINSLLSEEI